MTDNVFPKNDIFETFKTTDLPFKPFGFPHLLIFLQQAHLWTKGPNHMPSRLVLLDALRSLANGQVLLSPEQDNPLSFLVHLPGAPEVHIVLDRMKREKWIVPGPKQHGLQCWVITKEGRAVWEKGEEWYASLTWMQIVLARLGLPYGAQEPNDISKNRQQLS